MRFDGHLVTIADYEHYCKQITPPALWDHLYGQYGDSDWSTYTSNRMALNAIKLRPRVLIDVADPSLSTTLLNDTIAMPVAIGPTGIIGDIDPGAEAATVRAAGAAGTLLVLSAVSSLPAKEVADAAIGPWWQQVFLYTERARTEWTVRQAADLGASAIVLTVSNVGSTSYHQTLRYIAASAEAAMTAPATSFRDYPGPTESLYAITGLIDPGVTWADVDWLRGLTALPLVVKGIQTAEDAVLAVEHGASAIVVSNHGGRFLQGALGTIEALPEVVEAVDSAVEVYMDGGVRQGQDVLKALALGARAIWIGRAARWGQTVLGEAGVTEVLKILSDELAGTMGLAGVRDVRDVPRSVVTRSAILTQEH